MKRIYILAGCIFATVNILAIDPNGARISYDNGGDTPMWILVFWFIIALILGIPLAYLSLSMEDRYDKKFGCFIIISLAVFGLLLLKSCG